MTDASDRPPVGSGLDIVIRDAVGDDANLILSAWLKSYETRREMRCSTSDYYAGHHQAVQELLMRDGVMCKVACDPDDPRTLFGFVAYEIRVLHYVYVKQAVRRLDVATRLIDAAGLRGEEIEYTHFTEAFQALSRKLGLVARRNPYPFFQARKDRSHAYQASSV